MSYRSGNYSINNPAINNLKGNGMTYRGNATYGRSSDAEASRTLLEQQNERDLEELGSQVSALKSLSLEIHNEVKAQNRHLEGMGDAFNSAGDLFKGTLGKLGSMLTSPSSNHMYYLIAFIVFVFLVIYFSMGRK